MMGRSVPAIARPRPSSAVTLPSKRSNHYRTKAHLSSASRVHLQTLPRRPLCLRASYRSTPLAPFPPPQPPRQLAPCSCPQNPTSPTHLHSPTSRRPTAHDVPKGTSPPPPCPPS